MHQGDNIDAQGKPLQQVPWKKKIANRYDWFKRTADYYISQANLFRHSSEDATQMNQLWGVYHNEFPAHWFSHVTNPLNTKNPELKNYPAKIRPINILRTNIDQLVAEYHRRPFIYQVLNLGEDGYNRYTSSLQEKLTRNMTAHFVRIVQQQALENGLPVEEIPDLDDIPMPEEVQRQHHETYKDGLATDGQKWLRRALEEYKIRKKFRKGFLHWMVFGNVCTYKNIENDELVYELVDSRDIDYDKSTNEELIENGEWVVRREYYTLSDIVDKFYATIREQDLMELERQPHMASSESFFSHLNSVYSDQTRGKIPVYHVQWKGRKQIKFRMVVDAEGKLIQEPVDEEHVPAEGEKLDSMWVNEGYEVWRIGRDIYVNPRAIPVQRNAMNNFSKCKLSYNGARYAQGWKGTLSLLKMGVPIQIMYMITTYILEKTIAKSKGRIVLIDKNAIPNKQGWDDEKFFYYSDSMGYGLLNRNQAGVDKSWNQYQVLDMSLMKDIKELIELQNYFRAQWDITLGFNDQRKGQTMASSQSGAVTQSIFQSNIVTDLLFLNYEDFVESELQGLLDYSKFLNIDGVKGLYNASLNDLELLNIDPVAYCSAELGIILSRSPEEQEKVNMMKQAMLPLLQNGMKPSVFIEYLQASNMAELQTKLRQIEEIEQRTAEATQQAEFAAEEQADRRLAAIDAMRNELKLQLQEHEYQWKERIERLKGEMQMNSAALLSQDETISDVPDVNAIFDRYLKQFELSQKERMQTRELAQRERESVRKADTEKMKAKTALRNKVSGEK